jgi:hypothetical protein
VAEAQSGGIKYGIGDGGRGWSLRGFAAAKERLVGPV